MVPRNQPDARIWIVLNDLLIYQTNTGKNLQDILQTGTIFSIFAWKKKLTNEWKNMRDIYHKQKNI